MDMKYGILIVAVVVSSQLYGQAARMSASTFEAYNSYTINAQSLAPATINITATSVLPSSESASLLVPSVRINANEGACDIVVQEELVAGRIIDSDADTQHFELFMAKVKNLFALLKSDK